MGDWLQDRCNSIQKAQQEHIQKSLGTDIEKARAGVYKPTKQNLKEGKAGQKYGSEKKEDSKSKGVSRENHESLLKLVSDIEVNNQKNKRIKQDSIDSVLENLEESKSPDYNKALKLIQDYAFNDRGKTIKTESIWNISDKIEAELKNK
jgi:hypothetical protein